MRFYYNKNYYDDYHEKEVDNDDEEMTNEEYNYNIWRRWELEDEAERRLERFLRANDMG